MSVQDLSASNALHISNVSKRNKQAFTLKDIELKIEKGEIFGILGSEDDGRCELMRVIAGVDAPSHGTVIALSGAKIDLIDLNEPVNSGFKLFGGKEKGRSHFEKVSAQLDNSSADIIVIDNILAPLTTNERLSVIAKIKDLNARSKTIVLGSSRFLDIAALCGRLTVLLNGVAERVDTVQSVYDRPQSAGVAMATGRINLFDARRLTSTNETIPEFFSIVGEHRLYGAVTEKNALGAINQTIKLGIRPEHVSISTGASFPEDNLLKAVVEEIRFLGATTAVKLNANGLVIESRSPRIVGLNVGDECMIAMPPSLIQVFRS